MGAVTLTSDWPSANGPMTVADLDRTPDDGRRYELVDGVLVVSPAPFIPHQVVLGELEYVLRAALPDDLAIIPGVGLRMSDSTELVPDLVVARRDDLAGPRLTRPPLLAVEVRSRSTALFDLNIKKVVYERHGIDSYWIVVPDRDEPAITAFELTDGLYQLACHSAGDEEFRAVQPFAVTIVPSRLVAWLRG
ncbi:MAG: Uma2 family endonuclease [Streptosporangiaceae bacterium]